MMRNIQCVLILVLLVIVPSAVFAGTDTAPASVNAYEIKDVPKQRIYITWQSASEQEILTLRKRLIREGAEKVNLFFMDVIACEVPLSADPRDLIGDSRFSYLEESGIHASSSLDGVARVKQFYDDAAALASGYPGVAEPFFEDRVLVNSPELIEKSRRRPVEGSPGLFTQQRAVDENAEFMIGDILVRLVFPESQGAQNTETWTSQELRDANQGAVSGSLAFQTTYNYLPMNFVFTSDQKVSTSYEPIRHNLNNDASTWIPDVMATLGYPGLHETAMQVHNFNEDGRKRFGTDWVYTAFIADSRNEPGNVFSGSSGGAGYTAYANLGGPYLVIPFPAGAVNPNSLSELRLFSQIFQHEMVHIFWGLDEYPSAPSDCKSISGYLAYPNKNKVSVSPAGELGGCPDFVDCLMWNARAEESANRPLCFFTAGAMGVVDADGNGIPDVFDRGPVVEFEGAPAETVSTPSFTAKMHVTSQAVQNKNPLHDNPKSYAAPLKDATLNIDGIGETRLKPVDGRWDETEEDLTFSIQGLTPGVTLIQIRSRNAFGVSSPTVEKRIYFLGVNFSSIDFDVERDFVLVKWETVGETFGAQHDLYRIDTDTGEPVTSLVSVNAQPLNPGELFQRFDYVDRDVQPGHKYSYYVKGHFTLVSRPDTTYSSTFGPFDVRAMLPMKSGERVSNVAPNPFRESTTISIDVPKSFVDKDVDDIPGSAQIRIEKATEIKISVYDVKGRRVKDIFVGNRFSQVETFVWNGTNASGQRVPSGIYFIKAQAGSVLEVRKVVVVR